MIIVGNAVFYHFNILFLIPHAEIDPVPPNATVVFEVEVYSVSRGPRSMEAFGEMDHDSDKSLTKAEVTKTLKVWKKGLIWDVINGPSNCCSLRLFTDLELGGWCCFHSHSSPWKSVLALCNFYSVALNGESHISCFSLVHICWVEDKANSLQALHSYHTDARVVLFLSSWKESK